MGATLVLRCAGRCKSLFPLTRWGTTEPGESGKTDVLGRQNNLKSNIKEGVKAIGNCLKLLEYEVGDGGIQAIIGVAGKICTPCSRFPLEQETSTSWKEKWNSSAK